MTKKTMIMLLALVLSVVTMAQKAATGYDIQFKSMQIDPEPNARAWLSTFDQDTEMMFGSKFYKIVQFYQVPDQAEKEQLKQAGVDLLDYLPQMAYFAAFSSGFNPAMIDDRLIRSILEVDPAYKLDKALYLENFPAHAMVDNSTINLLISYYRDIEPAVALASLEAAGVRVAGGDDFGKYFRVTAAISDIRRIAGLPFVVFVEPVAPEPTPENYTGRTLHHTNAIATDYLAGRHYDGTGVNVMLQDDGVIGPHLDYKGRIGAQYLTNNDGNHGDHCAGIIMAAGNRDPRARGNAFGATLWVYSVSPNYPGFSAIPTVYSSLGIRVTSASYGDGCNAGYSSLTRTLDQQVRTYPSLMHVFSAGNSGTENCGYGAGSGWGNITGGHKQGKNVIAVANLDLQDELSGSSSRGPAHDGRIKPDIGAKGTNVYSTIDPNIYGNKSGTSMACPGIAGTLAQLIQAYRMLKNGKDPMAGLLKATVLNTAEDLGNPGPDFKFGWGRVNALRAVKVFEESRYDSGVVSQGTSGSHNIAVPPGTAQLRVMVYWTDYEASVNTNLALVNNLNITLTDPSAISWNPWILSHYPHPDSLNKPAWRGIDIRNNMEQITIDNPASGIHTLDVAGVTVPQGPQTYYVVYEFIPQTVVLTYPVGGESLVPGETETIRWDAFGSNDPFMLEFSVNNGQDWDTLAANIQAGSRFYTWTVPAVVTGNALVKISRAGSSSQCEAPFSIIGVPCNLVVDWRCGDSLHLSWNGVGGATTYEVFKLGEKYMDAVGTTNILSMVVVDTNAVGSTWLSVRALGAAGAVGRRAVAIEKAPGTFNCQPKDAMMAAAATAQWGVFQACMELSTVTVPVEVRNTGQEPLVNPTLHFRFDNEPVVTETYTGTILPDSTLHYLFAQKINLSAIGSHLLKTWVQYPQDVNPANDSLVIPLEVVAGVTFPFDGSQTFESWTKCLSSPVCEAYSCELADGWLNLANSVYDQHDWRTFSGSTPSAGTGPDVDHTLGNTAGKYLYIEPTMYCLNKVASLSTPCIDLTGSAGAKVTVWYHAYGADIHSFHADLFDGTSVVDDVVSPVSGSQGNEWHPLEIDLTPWAGKVIGLRFRGISGCNEKGDFAIDDFSIDQVMVSVDEQTGALAGQLKIYPNPADQTVSVSLKDAGDQAYALHIVDMYGRVVYSGEVRPRGSRISETIDISSLAHGIYVVAMKSDQRKYQQKLIIR